MNGTVLVSAGFSCKTISPLNCNRVKDGAANAIKSETGTTGGTFRALHMYNMHHSVPFQIIENVPQLLSGSGSNWPTVAEHYNKAGYSIRATVGDAQDHGATLSRSRAFGFAIHRELLGLTKAGADEIAEKCVKLFRNIKIHPVRSFQEILLSDDDDLVVQELTHVLDHKGKTQATIRMRSGTRPTCSI